MLVSSLVSACRRGNCATVVIVQRVYWILGRYWQYSVSKYELGTNSSPHREYCVFLRVCRIVSRNNWVVSNTLLEKH